MNKDNRDKTLENIFNAIDLEPVKVSKSKKLKLKAIKFFSNNRGTFMAYVILGIVLAILVGHLIGSIADRGKELTVKDHWFENDCFYVTIDGGTIDRNSSHMTNPEGTVTVHPDVIRRTNPACFKCDRSDDYTIYIYSVDGREVTMVLSVD